MNSEVKHPRLRLVLGSETSQESTPAKTQPIFEMEAVWPQAYVQEAASQAPTPHNFELLM